MKFSNKILLLILLFIITFIIGFCLTRIIIQEQYKNINIEVEVSCRTKDKKDIKILTEVNYDNNEKRSKYFIKKAINESCMYMFHLYTLDEIKNNSNEIETLTTENIFNRLQIQDKGFMIYKFKYTIKEE